MEILNELDTLKSALMINAGARAVQGKDNTLPWEVTAKTVERITSSVDIAKLFGNALGGIATSSLRNLSRAVEAYSSRRNTS